MNNKMFLIRMTALVFGIAFAGCDNGTGSTPDYHVGGVGSFGEGWVFYDKGEYSDGWRYMEVSPDEFSGIWGVEDEDVPGTLPDAEKGKENTRLIEAKHPSDAHTYAANICRNYRGGYKDDWFLPSKEELDLIYTNINMIGLGNFQNSWYWSSTQYNQYTSWVQDFTSDYPPNSGKQYNIAKNAQGGLIRPVRAF
jgi:hypothetical protein